MKLYVDDVRDAPEGWEVARDFFSATLHIYAGGIAALSLDHDLGSEDGYDIAKWMCGLLPGGPPPLREWPRHIYCHSMNPVGRENILALLERYAPDGVDVHR